MARKSHSAKEKVCGFENPHKILSFHIFRQKFCSDFEQEMCLPSEEKIVNRNRYSFFLPFMFQFKPQNRHNYLKNDSRNEINQNHNPKMHTMTTVNYLKSLF